MADLSFDDLVPSTPSSTKKGVSFDDLLPGGGPLPPGPAAPRVTPKPPVPEELKPPAPKGREMYEPSEIGVSGALGAGAGLAAPEIAAGVGRGITGLGSVIGMAPFPPAQVLGRTLQAGGMGITAAAPLAGRAAPALQGLIGGLLGETAGQTSELLDQPQYVSEAARIGFGLTPTQVLAWGAKKAGGGIAGSAISAAVKNLAKKEGWESVASKEEKAAIEKLVGDLFQQDPESKAAQSLYRQLETETARLRQMAEQRAGTVEAGGARATRVAEQRLEQNRAALQNVGNPDAEFDAMGRSLRGSMVRHQETGVEARNTPYGEARAEVERIARQRQAAGDLVEGTQAYQMLLSDLRRLARVGREGQEVALAEVTEPGVEGAYRQILNALERKQALLGTSADPTVAQRAQELRQRGLMVREATSPDGVVSYYREYPTSYEALDDVRRRLGAQAKFGEPTTGYEALKTDQAGNLYGRIRQIQSEYIGEPFDQMQSIYERGTAALQPFEGKAGQRAVGVDLADPDRYRVQPQRLASDIFGSRQGVDDFLRLSGNDTATLQREASNYVARSLRGKSAAEAETWLNSKNQEFLRHPALQNVYTRASDYFQRIQTQEELARRGARFGAEAPKRAEAIVKGTEKIADTMLGDVTAVPRIEALIKGGKVSEWDQVGPILTRTEQGRENLAAAVSNVMAAEALSNRAAAAKTFRDKVAPNLQRVNMDPYRIKEIQDALDRVESFVLPPQAKLTFAQDLAQKFIRQYAIPRAGTGAMELVGGQ
jgi:hypothetical protein